MAILPPISAQDIDKLVDTIERTLAPVADVSHATFRFLNWGNVDFRRKLLRKIVTDAPLYYKQLGCYELKPHVNSFQKYVVVTASQLNIPLGDRQLTCRSYKGLLLACVNLVYTILVAEKAEKAFVDMDTFKATLMHLPEFLGLEDRNQWKTLLNYRNYLSSALHLVDKSANLLMLAESAALLVGESRCLQGSHLGIEAQRLISVRDIVLVPVKKSNVPKSVRQPKQPKQRSLQTAESEDDEGSVNTVPDLPQVVVQPTPAHPAAYEQRVTTVLTLDQLAKQLQLWRAEGRMLANTLCITATATFLRPPPSVTMGPHDAMNALTKAAAIAMGSNIDDDDSGDDGEPIDINPKRRRLEEHGGISMLSNVSEGYTGGFTAEEFVKMYQQ